MPRAYPAHWEADVVLRDGRTCHVRPITPADSERLVQFHARLSAQTIYYRYFAPYPELSARDVARSTTVDHDDRAALVATQAGELIGVARYERIDASQAEVAFVVRDDHQGRGIAAVLLEHLAAAAWERGLRRFVAEVLPTNRRMLATFREAGYAIGQSMEDGVVHVSFELAATEAVIRVRAAREQRSEARSVERLLEPNGVVVIGASRTPGRIGHEVLRHLRDQGLSGPLYAVHPEATQILGVPTYAHMSDVPERVDLAVVAVPADSVLAVVGQCAAAGVSGLVVISSGFADTATDEGHARQRALVGTAREFGMRVVGPNCLGIINTDPGVGLNASMSPMVPSRGGVGLFCQSGALGVTVLETVARRGIGLSSFVSAGNRADVSANDLLQYWESDQATSMVLLYLESVGNPRKFMRIARRLSRTKPVVALRSGRYTQTLPLGQRARRSSLPPMAVDAVFAQAGVVQTSSLTEMFDVAAVLAYQPLATGDRVAVLGTSSALELLAVDAVEAARLTVSAGHPSLAQSADADQIRAALAAAVSHPDADMVVFVHIPNVGADQADVHEAITQVSATSTKPVVAVIPAADGTGLIPAGMGLLALPGSDGRPVQGSVPTFSTVEDAVRSLALARGYARWREAESPEPADLPDVHPARARALVQRVLSNTGAGAGAGGSGAGAARADRGGEADATPSGVQQIEVQQVEAQQFEAQQIEAQQVEAQLSEVQLSEVQLSEDQVAELLACYGIRVWPAVPVQSEQEAVAAAEQLGYPVVLKTTAPWLAHRVDLGSVRLNLDSEATLRAAHRSMMSQLDERASARLVVQAMAPTGVATVLSAVDDLLFGPVVRFGIGGVASDLLGDHAYRIPPLTLTEARRLVSTPRAAPLLHGYRGADPVDTEALCDLVARVGLLIDHLPQVAALDLNPVVVSTTGAVVLGASARVRPASDRIDVGVRRLLDA